MTFVKKVKKSYFFHNLEIVTNVTSEMTRDGWVKQFIHYFKVSLNLQS